MAKIMTFWPIGQFFMAVGLWIGMGKYLGTRVFLVPVLRRTYPVLSKGSLYYGHCTATIICAPAAALLDLTIKKNVGTATGRTAA